MNESVRYDRISIGYTQHRRADRRLVDAIIGHLGLNEGDTLADIGAGSGNYSRALADHNLRVISIEPSKVMRQQAKPHQGVTWIDGTAEDIPLDNDSVTSVVATLSTHHFSSLENAAKEMMRVSSQSIVIFTAWIGALSVPMVLIVHHWRCSFK